MLSMYATKIFTNEHGITVIKYHDTEIVKFNNDYFVINFGGFDTVTTRRKMNQASNQFNLGFSIFRRKGITYMQNGRDITEISVNFPMVFHLTNAKG